MNKKQMNKIKYGVVSCIVALSLIICINAPVAFKAAVSEYLGGYNSGNYHHYEYSPVSNTCINNSVVVYNDYFAGGTVYTEYTKFDAYCILGSVKCLNPYSAIWCHISAFNFDLLDYQNMNGFQFVFGTYEELESGNYHTVLAADGVTDFIGVTWDEVIFREYGTGEEIYIAMVFSCYATASPGSTVSRIASISFNFSGTIELYGYDILGASDLIYQKLDEIYGTNEEISADLKNILSKYDSIEDGLSELSQYVQNNYNKLASIDARIIQLSNQIAALNDKLNSLNSGIGDVNDELDKHTNWLEKIWNSIQEFLKMNQEQEVQQENINNSVNGSLGNLGNLSNDLNFSKPDINDINVNVNQYIPQEYIDDYSSLLKVFTGHTVVKDMLLIAFTVCIISYTLFGKKR